METNSDSKPSSPSFPSSLLHNELKGYLDAFESKLIGIGLVSKEIQENVMEHVIQHVSDPEVEDDVLKEMSRNQGFCFTRIKNYVLLILFLLTTIQHCITISWYVLRHQEGNMRFWTKVFSNQSVNQRQALFH